MNSGRGRTVLSPYCEDSAGDIHKGKDWVVLPDEFVSMGYEPIRAKPR